MEPRFNEVAGDRPNLFVKLRVRYIENLDITNLRGNHQNVRYIEVIVNDWFSTQVTSVTQFNAIFVTQKCRVLRCNSLSMVAFSSNYFHFWADAQLLFTKKRHFQSVDLFSVYLLSRVDIVIRYIEVLFHTFYSNFGRDIEYRSLFWGLR